MQLCYKVSWTNPGSNISQNICMASYLPSQKPSKSDEQEMLDKQGWTHKGRSSMDLFIWTYQCWLTSKNLYTTALCGHSKTCQERWMIRMDGWVDGWRESERESGKSVLLAQLDVIYIKGVLAFELKKKQHKNTIHLKG